MFGKINFSFLLLHIYIITYLIITVVGAPDLVMQIMHLMAPLFVIPFLYHIIKSATYTSASRATNEKKESYKTS